MTNRQTTRSRCALIAAALLLMLSCVEQASAGTPTVTQTQITLGDRLNQPSVSGIDLGLMGTVLDGPSADVIAGVTEDILSGDFDAVGSSLASIGLNRWWWEQYIDVAVHAPSGGNPYNWEFDIMFSVRFPQERTFSNDPLVFACTMALPAFRPPGSDFVPALVSQLPVTQCWDTTEASLANVVALGMQELISNDMFLDTLFPVGYSIFGDGPQTNANGERSQSCSELRWDSPGGRIAAVGGGAGGAAGAVTGVGASGIVAAVGGGVSGFLMGQGLTFPLGALGATAANIGLIGVGGGLVLGAVVVGAAVVAAGVAARAAYASMATGCPGCNAMEQKGEDCRVLGDECICKDEADWNTGTHPPPPKPSDDEAWIEHDLEGWARKEMRESDSTHKAPEPPEYGGTGGTGSCADGSSPRTGDQETCDLLCVEDGAACTYCLGEWTVCTQSAE